MSAAGADIVSSAGRDADRASTPTSEIGMPLMIPGAFDARVPRVAPLDATPESEPRARARAAALGLASLTDPERATFGTRLWHCLRHPGDFQTLWRDHLPRSR